MSAFGIEGDRKGALAAYEKDLAIAEGIVAQDPGNARWQRDVAISYNNIGDVRWDEGDRKGALAVYEKALAIAERLAAQDPGNAGWQWDLAASYERMGGIRMAEGEGETARNPYGKAGSDDRKNEKSGQSRSRTPGNAIYERAPSFICGASAATPRYRRAPGATGRRHRRQSRRSSGRSADRRGCPGCTGPSG